MGSLLYKCRDAHGNFEPSRALHLDDPSSSPPFSSSFILLNFSVILLGFLCCMCIARSIRFALLFPPGLSTHLSFPLPLYHPIYMLSRMRRAMNMMGKLWGFMIFVTIGGNIAGALPVTAPGLPQVVGALPMYVDELPQMPRVYGYTPSHGSFKPGRLTIGMFKNQWVRMTTISLLFL